MKMFVVLKHLKSRETYIESVFMFTPILGEIILSLTCVYFSEIGWGKNTNKYKYMMEAGIILLMEEILHHLGWC